MFYLPDDNVVSYTFTHINSLCITLLLSISYVGCLYIYADQTKRYIELIVNVRYI